MESFVPSDFVRLKVIIRKEGNTFWGYVFKISKIVHISGFMKLLPLYTHSSKVIIDDLIFDKKVTKAQVFSCEFYEIFKNTFSTELLLATASRILFKAIFMVENHWNRQITVITLMGQLTISSIFWRFIYITRFKLEILLRWCWDSRWWWALSHI